MKRWHISELEVKAMLIFHKNKEKLAIFALDYLSKMKYFKVCFKDTFDNHCSCRLSKTLSLTF